MYPAKSTAEANEFTTALQQEEVLICDLKKVAQCVSPDPSNLLAWGTDIRNLLIVACTEVESQMKGVMKANGARPTFKHFTTVDYVKLLKPMRLR